MITMLIRKFRYNDAEKVSDLIKKVLLEVNSKDYSKSVIHFMCNHFTPERIIKNSNDRTTFVAIQNDKIIGTISLKKNVIHLLFVNPKLHKKGLGTKLVNRAEKLAVKNKYKTIVVPSSITALVFYKKLGYKEFKRVIKKKYGKIIIMKKRLSIPSNKSFK